jgi:hypothetical protein
VGVSCKTGYPSWTFLQHAKTVSLLLSLTTGLVSPQYHVKYDDIFETLVQGAASIKSEWQQLAGFEGIKVKGKRKAAPEVAVIPHTEHAERTDPSDVPATEEVVNQEMADPFVKNDTVSVRSEGVPDGLREIEDSDEEIDRSTMRSGRRKTSAPYKFKDYLVYMSESMQIDTDHPLVYASSADPDVMYLNEAMAAPHKKEFVRAMMKELKSHTDKENWLVMDRKDVPSGHKVLPAVWAMRRKRDIATQESRRPD